MPNRDLLKPIGTDVFEEHPMTVRLPDGEPMAFIHDLKSSERDVYGRFSQDNGTTWSEPRTLFSPGDQPEGLDAVIWRLSTRDSPT